MSYTNSTPNLHLPQYIATDKPTYLGDWNASMQTIDTVITATQATANGANSTAVSANSTAQAAQNTANIANTKADTNSTNITALTNDYNTTQNPTTATESLSSPPVFRRNTHTLTFYGIETQTESKPSGVIVGSYTKVPIFSTEGNIFNESVTNISDDFSTHFHPGNVIIKATVSSGNEIFIKPTYAYFDGANTNFYILFFTSEYSTINALNNISINFVVIV